MRRALALVLLLAVPAASFAQDFTAFGPRPVSPFSVPLDPAAPPAPEWLATTVAPEMLSPLTLEVRSLSSDKPAKPKKEKKGRKKKDEKPKPAQPAGMALGPERARILLRSLTVPGWGQATMGRRTSAKWFVAAEAGVWTAFGAFRAQEVMRRESAMRTARLAAGIDLRGRDEEFQRIVGSFVSSEEYNLLVVARDAANIYLLDPYHPDMEGYRAYVAAHSLSGADAWNWGSLESFRKYSAQRKDANRAGLRANTAIAVGIANRIASAIHAARAAGRAPAVEPPRSWNFEVTPDPRDGDAVRAGLRVTF
ncbi:MAG: hypothetical protein HZA61_08990 [Candidatus Eisenbacteria bacterium]|uniref:DUF5683 domain-containing protein n=1 Tax=Eiseniibacteriota bacterium TaxID=2212470 RepID=A0A933SC35_UNCEI|nr:hypothetical protein [Candidatus Eisenbacteria bacterium]